MKALRRAGASTHLSATRGVSQFVALSVYSSQRIPAAIGAQGRHVYVNSVSNQDMSAPSRDDQARHSGQAW